MDQHDFDPEFRNILSSIHFFYCSFKYLYEIEMTLINIEIINHIEIIFFLKNAFIINHLVASNQNDISWTLMTQIKLCKESCRIYKSPVDRIINWIEYLNWIRILFQSFE